MKSCVMSRLHCRAACTWHRDRSQDRLDLGPIRLVLWRQLECLAQRLLGLVDEEARAIGGDLEEHTAGLPEVDRLEVLPVDHGSDTQRMPQDTAPELELMGGIGGP